MFLSLSLDLAGYRIDARHHVPLENTDHDTDRSNRDIAAIVSPLWLEHACTDPSGTSVETATAGPDRLYLFL